MILKTFSNLKWVLPTLLISSCQHGQIPTWNGKIWAGNANPEPPAQPGITRAQSGEHINAGDPMFDEYMAMSYADFREFFRVYVIGCKEWYPNTPMMDAKQAFEVFRIAAEKEIK